MTVAQQLEDIIGVSLTEKKSIIELRQFHDNNAFCCDEDGKVIGLCACENDFERLVLPSGPLLENLLYLNLSDNVSLLSLDIETALRHLQHLDLSDSKLKQLRLLDGFTALRWLDISRNGLEQFIPEGEFRSLEYLDLSGNQLSDFKTHLLYKFPSLKGLYLKGNPLHESKRTSVARVGNCLSFLWDFQQELELGAEENKEYKVILVGNGGVGKTCLVERLVYNTFREQHFSTHGVSLEKYEKEDFPYVLNLWDFAGQDIYHATHRLFMQADAIYLLLWDEETRKADSTRIEERGEFISYENHDLYYWLDYIKPNEGTSSVIVIKTKSAEDKAAHPDQASLDSIFKDPGSMSIDWHEIDSELQDWKENGFERLLALLKMNIELMTRDEELPRSWANLRNHMRQLLQQGEKKLISLQEYEDIAADYGIRNCLKVLTDWLVPTGVVFYRENYFEDAVIIDQSWAMEAIYIIFNRNEGYYEDIGKNKGRFSGKDLSRFWQDQNKEYSTAEKELLLNFMLGCELCFEIDQKKEDNQHQYISFEKRLFISPQLLSTETPETVDVFKRYNPDRLYVQYRSRSLHYGLIQSFIVKTQYLANLEGIWKYGILLHEDNTNALVKGHSNQIEVEVPLAGLVILDKIRNLINEFPRKDLEEWVSLDGANFVKLADLQGWKYETIQADTMAPIPTAELQVFLNRNAQSTFNLPKPKRSNAALIEQIEEEQLSKETVKQQQQSIPNLSDHQALKFLFLAASPQNISAISWEKERSTIERKLIDRIERKECELSVKSQVSQDDMWESISDFKPHLLHFSGHGVKKRIQPDGSIANDHGLVLHQDGGVGLDYLQPLVLKDQFKMIRDLVPELGLVFLNACYSDEAAKAISYNQIYAIGTRTEVISEAAQQFSAAFYRSYLKQQNLGYAIKTAKLTGARFDKDTINAYVLYYNGEEVAI